MICVGMVALGRLRWAWSEHVCAALSSAMTFSCGTGTQANIETDHDWQHYGIFPSRMFQVNCDKITVLWILSSWPLFTSTFWQDVSGFFVMQTHLLAFKRTVHCLFNAFFSFGLPAFVSVITLLLKNRKRRRWKQRKTGNQKIKKKIEKDWSITHKCTG